MTTPQDTPPRHRRLVALVVTAGLVLAVLVAYLLWWSRPTAFSGHGNVLAGPGPIGETRFMSLLVPQPDEPVHLRAVRPVVTTNSADAAIDYVVCEDGEVGVGGGSGTLPTPECPAFRPLAEVDLDAVDWSEQSLVARITPRRPGVVRIDGADMTYTRDWRHLWQTGTERTGVEIEVRTR